MTAHLDLEQLAAFLDDRLREPERRSVVDHLADCPDCYEVFAESARHLEQDGDEIGTVVGAASRFRRQLPWIASAVAAGIAAIVLLSPLRGVLFPPGDREMAVLLAELPKDAALGAGVRESLDAHGFAVQRGVGSGVGETPGASFRLGVRVVELEAALAAGDLATATLVTHRIEAELDPRAGAGPALVAYVGADGVRGALERNAPEAARERSRQAERLLRTAVDEPAYRLGGWIAAAEIADRAGRLDSWASSEVREMLAEIDPATLPEALRPTVQDLRRLLESGISEGEIGAVRRSIERVMELGGSPTPGDSSRTRDSG